MSRRVVPICQGLLRTQPPLSLSGRLGGRLQGLLRAAVLAAAAATTTLITTPAQSQDEVPFVVTPDAVTEAMLKLAGVGPQDHVIDLGSGDGRIVITAARRFGATGLGVEIVADLVQQSRDNARRAGVAERTEFRQQDLFATDLSAATVVTMYLLPDVNLQLRDRLLALKPGTRIVSHDWDMGAWAPDRTLELEVPDKPVGRDKLSRVHLWTVPAALHGRWCADGGRLQMTQRFQHFSASVYLGQEAVPAMVFDGSIQGAAAQASGRHFAHLAAVGERLLLRQIAAPAALLQGQWFARC